MSTGTYSTYEPPKQLFLNQGMKLNRLFWRMVINPGQRTAWGYVAREETEAIRRWQHWLDSDEDFDPTLNFSNAAKNESAWT